MSELAAGAEVLVWRKPDGTYLVCDHDGHPVARFLSGDDGWWTIIRANGTRAQVWSPGAEPLEIAIRALRS